MKIKVSLDAGYVFDMLAILMVKSSFKDDQDIGQSLAELSEEIIFCIGAPKYYSIVGSQAFYDLFDKNKEIFLAVDKAKKDEVKASYVDSLNYDRWVIKNKLQKAFFGSETLEKKIGY